MFFLSMFYCPVCIRSRITSRSCQHIIAWFDNHPHTLIHSLTHFYSKQLSTNNICFFCSCFIILRLSAHYTGIRSLYNVGKWIVTNVQSTHFQCTIGGWSRIWMSNDQSSRFLYQTSNKSCSISTSDRYVCHHKSKYFSHFYLRITF